MRYTLANTTELSVEFGINYISDYDTAPPTLADRVQCSTCRMATSIQL